MKVQAAWMNQTFRLTFCSAQVFSSEIWDIFKNTFWEHSVEHSRSSKVLFVNCSLCNWIIPWSFENFCEVGDGFFMAAKLIHYWYHFQKNVWKQKKVSNLNLLDTWYNLLLLYLYLDTIYYFYTYIWGSQCKWKIGIGSLWTRKK